MNEFTTITLIARPVEDVFAVIPDIARIPVWPPGLCQARQPSEDRLEPDATLIYAGTFPGLRHEPPASAPT